MKLRVVLIDRNLAFLTSAQRFLEMLPGVYALSFSTAARNVVSELRTAEPDLVLLDIALPDAIRSRLENAMASLKKTPQVVNLSLHEKGTQTQYVGWSGKQALVNKANFVQEIVPIIDSLRASANADHSV